jgi:hypothetical protein
VPACEPAFIFMLTRGDATVADAPARLREALDAGVRHVGFKDIGLPLEALRGLADTIRGSGATLYLEMVGLGAESEAASARAALALGIDVLMGGICPEVVLPIIEGSPIRYYPFPGEVVGHPSRLTGSLESIVESARALAECDGVHGLDLLAYRFEGDVPALARAVCQAAGQKPVILAGSIDCAERIQAVIEAGAAGFTVGTAALDGAFPASPRLADQLAYIAARLH